MCSTIDEALYGGAAGGGKSDALLMGALQFVHIPGYAAILFRRSFTDLSLPEALMSRGQEWLGRTVARWRDVTKTWHFPSGATLTFAYLASDADKYRYQSAAFQFIGFDELTQFPEAQYIYLFSRLRRPIGMRGVVPLRMRAASNPGGIGHQWVKNRFIDVKNTHPDRRFFPAGLADNPHLDAEAYTKAMMNLDPVTRAQLLEGDWTVRATGGKFLQEWFIVIDAIPDNVTTWVRFWDMAATRPRPGHEPDWTAGCLMGLTSDNRIVIADMRRFQEIPAETERIIKEVAEYDRRRVGTVSIRMELEPGSSGLIAIDAYARGVLRGYDFQGERSTGDKVTRANPLSAAVYNRQVSIISGAWLPDFISEAEAFWQPGVNDDQIDAASGAFSFLSEDVFMFHV